MAYYVYHIHVPGMGLDEGYIGISVEPKRRWTVHKSTNENPHLKRALSKYKDKIKFTILACFDTKEEALWQELTLRPLDRMGWNIVKGGGSPPVNNRVGEKAYNFGKKLSEETKQKISEVLSGRTRSLEHCAKIAANKSGNKHHMARPANVYTKDGVLVAEGVNLSVFCKERGWTRTGLNPKKNRPKGTYKGLYARYVDELHSETVEGTS